MNTIPGIHFPEEKRTASKDAKQEGHPMKAAVLLDLCHQVGIDFFAGVPDSQLKGLCSELYARYGTAGTAHIVAPNEGGAIALCAGHYLATGRPALCYMQNSGLGNAVNPLASLMDSRVYALPCLLVIGWRGEPGVPDEPQHVRQGVITPDQLKLLDIPFMILSPETGDMEFADAFRSLTDALSSGKCAAILVRKGALTTDAAPSWDNGRSLMREEAAGTILAAAGETDLFVSTTGKLSREIFEIRERRGEGHDRDFLTVGSMGHASLIALRLAEEKPDRRVWCLDGDGALLMHLGALALMGSRQPANLIHVVINNGAHETVGGMPVCDRKLDIPALARAAGYTTVLTAEEDQELRLILSRALSARGPLLLEVRCACGARADLGRPTIPPVRNREAFMRFVRSAEI